MLRAGGVGKGKGGCEKVRRRRRRKKKPRAPDWKGLCVQVVLSDLECLDWSGQNHSLGKTELHALGS